MIKIIHPKTYVSCVCETYGKQMCSSFTYDLKKSADYQRWYFVELFWRQKHCC